MPLEDSPSLEQYQDGLPEPPASAEPPSPRARRRGAWWAATAVLLVIVVALAAWNVIGTALPGDSQAGQGSVVGRVIDAEGRPLSAEILVDGSDLATQTGADGRFDLQGVPAGQRTVLIAVMYVAHAYPVTVRADTVTDLGDIRIAGRARASDDGRLEWR